MFAHFFTSTRSQLDALVKEYDGHITKATNITPSPLFSTDEIRRYTLSHLIHSELKDQLDEKTAREWKTASAPLVKKAWSTVAAGRQTDVTKSAAQAILSRYTRACLTLNRIKAERSLTIFERHALELNRLERRIEALQITLKHPKALPLVGRDARFHIKQLQERAVEQDKEGAIALRSFPEIWPSEKANFTALRKRRFALHLRTEEILRLLPREPIAEHGSGPPDSAISLKRSAHPRSNDLTRSVTEQQRLSGRPEKHRRPVAV